MIATNIQVKRLVLVALWKLAFDLWFSLDISQPVQGNVKSAISPNIQQSNRQDGCH